MGNTLCGSIVVIAIPNAHTQDDATDSLSLRSFYGKNYVLLQMQTPFCAIRRSWTLLAAFGGSYAPDTIHIEIPSLPLGLPAWCLQDVFAHFDTSKTLPSSGPFIGATVSVPFPSNFCS